MKIELTENEADYLADKTFWDWKRAEIDLWSIEPLHIKGKLAKKIKEEEKWYKNLYLKLGGEEWKRKEKR